MLLFCTIAYFIIQQVSMLPQLQLDLPDVRRHLVNFLRTEFARAGVSRAVIGLSGGIDSALAAFLTAEALGANNLLCIMMPHRSSSPESLIHAGIVADALHVRHERIDISPLVDAAQATDPDMDRLRLGNIMARARMILLYDRSARERALVVGTGNRTEFLLGYTTLFGDSACALNPVGDLYKTQVWALSEHLGVPEPVIRKHPSADLWAGQTDEAEMGVAYRLADEILHHLVDLGLSEDEVVARGYDAEAVALTRRRMHANAFKRLPVPVGFLRPRV